MKDEWLALMASLAVDETTAVALYADLTAHYEVDGRYYHNLSHIQNMLQTIRSMPADDYDETAVQLAVWFHDVIYDSRAADNEAQSAAYARQVLTPLLAPELVAEVERLILLTITHDTAVTDVNGRALLDADLATLGSDPATYDRYGAAIRREYAWVPDEIYRRERAKLLTRFLQKERIFIGAAFREQFEDRARQNLRRELAQLTG
jgi:predicted metal-dependent HD superfamily phosphohydrolase